MAKSRYPSVQDLIWRLEALAFDALSLGLRALPVDLVSASGGALFRFLGPLSSAHRVADLNLRLAFPEMGPAQRKRLVASQWDNVGRLIAEFPLTDRLTTASGRVEIVGSEHLDAVVSSGRPAIYISGHISNWEISVQAPLSTGLPCEMTYREANNPYIDARIKLSRARHGVRLFAPKGGEGARRLLAALNRGVSVAMLNDQKYDEGVAAPFFGRTVPMHRPPADRAERHRRQGRRHSGGGHCDQRLHRSLRSRAPARVVLGSSPVAGGCLCRTCGAGVLRPCSPARAVSAYCRVQVCVEQAGAMMQPVTRRRPSSVSSSDPL